MAGVGDERYLIAPRLRGSSRGRADGPQPPPREPAHHPTPKTNPPEAEGQEPD